MMCPRIIQCNCYLFRSKDKLEAVLERSEKRAFQLAEQLLTAREVCVLVSASIFASSSMFDEMTMPGQGGSKEKRAK